MVRQDQSPGTRQRTLSAIPQLRSKWKEAKAQCDFCLSLQGRRSSWTPGTAPAGTQTSRGSGGEWIRDQDKAPLAQCKVQRWPQSSLRPCTPSRAAPARLRAAQTLLRSQPWQPSRALGTKYGCSWHWELICVPSRTSRLFWSSFRRWNLFYWSVFLSSKYRYWKLKTNLFVICWTSVNWVVDLLRKRKYLES